MNVLLQPSILFLDETQSTNTLLKEKLQSEKLPPFFTISTAFQSSGRGQRGNGWNSQKGKNLLFSTVIYPTNIAPNKQFILSQIVALSIVDVLEEYNKGFEIKWPNDIYYREKKICGILIENILNNDKIDYSIIGIGLNINQSKFRKNLPNPISLCQITGQTYNINEILQGVLQNLSKYCNNLNRDKIAEINTKYRKILFHGDGYYFYADSKSTFKAKIIDIEPNGTLILQRTNGTLSRYLFKEVKFLFEQSHLGTF